MDEKLMRVMMYLPPHTARRISSLTERSPDVSGDITEIRLHGGRPTALVISGRNVTDFAGECDVCTDAELSQTLARLTEDSVHTYGDTLREGFVSLDGGYRIGVCGSANTSDGKIRGLCAVGTLTIRIPRAITGCDRELLAVLQSDGAISSALIYSQPGVGKTTLIRALASSLSRGKDARRVSVIDTRREIFMEEMFGDSTADFFEGYPRGAGIEIATRTQNPEAIICDEIGGEDEVRAVLASQNAGVPLIATAHGKSVRELYFRPNIKMLIDAGVFRYLIGISRRGGDFVLDVTDAREGT